MNAELAIVLLMLAAAVVMFIVNRPRMDAVALLVIVAMPLTGIVTMSEALAGFSDPSIVLIAALFVIGEGLVRTGVARRLGDWLDTKAGGSDTRLLVLLMAAVGGLGALMSSTAVVAIFIPVVLRISQNRGTSPSRLMMPLSFAALISGMLTLVATAPNLVVNAELIRQGSAGFGFFSFTPFGLPLLILGIFYMLFARKMLGGKGGPGATLTRRPSLRDWVERYALTDRAQRVRLALGSPLAGRRLEEVSLRASGVNLLAIERGTGRTFEVIRPSARTRLEPGDMLLVDVLATPEQLDALRTTWKVERVPLGDGDYFSDRSQELGMVEVMLPAESRLIGSTVLEARVRSEYGLTVIGLRHGAHVASSDLLHERLKLGDTLLMVGFWSDIRALQGDTEDLIVLNMPAELEEVLPAASRAPQALGVLALVVALMVSGVIPNVQAAIIGCLLMGLLHCVDFNSAYRSISWKSLILIVGMLPFSIALQRTGGVDLAADAVVALVGQAAPHLVLGTIFVITALLGLFISNTATAVLMAPVALAIAKDLGASPYPFAMVVAIAASSAFMTPISSPVNTLVVGPGQYSFGDFVKVGVPFTIVAMIVSVFLIPIFLPL
ncbi:SLC13 family permease [Roseixanthobacter pseudopolyaromaticivorans]|uniref:SLC13 family permease n=1 Tax=Xanthobacteraceae TaxID=335928 RepID=UPI0037265524